MRRSLALLLALAALLTACGGADPIVTTDAPSPTVVPATITLAPAISLPTLLPASATKPPATAMPVPPTVTVPPFVSGGLGLSQAAWEAAHGLGEQHKLRYDYEAGAYSVFYWDPLETGRDQHVELLLRSWPSGMALGQAQQAAQALIPADVQLVQRCHSTESPPAQWEIYRSVALIGQYAARSYPHFRIRPTPSVADLPWGIAAPGLFNIEYYQNSLNNTISFVQIVPGTQQVNGAAIPCLTPVK